MELRVEQSNDKVWGVRLTLVDRSRLGAFGGDDKAKAFLAVEELDLSGSSRGTRRHEAKEKKGQSICEEKGEG
jgi:hypothetical protein